jgi:hypothetical protein
MAAVQRFRHADLVSLILNDCKSIVRGVAR